MAVFSQLLQFSLDSGVTQQALFQTQLFVERVTNLMRQDALFCPTGEQYFVAVGVESTQSLVTAVDFDVVGSKTLGFDAKEFGCFFQFLTQFRVEGVGNLLAHNGWTRYLDVVLQIIGKVTDALVDELIDHRLLQDNG